MSKFKYILFSSVFLMLFSSCEDYVTLDAPKGSLGAEDVFSSPANAEAAVLNLYSGATSPINQTLYIREILADNVVNAQGGIAEFENNEVLASSNYVANYWYYHYQEIRKANYIVHGLTSTTGVEEAFKRELLGEARFWRAYHYTTLVMLYDRVPLVLTDDSVEDALLPLSSNEEIWDQIFSDLQYSKENLPPDYITGQRVRANSLAATALLARAHLYHGDYEEAETEASIVISSGLYSFPEGGGVEGTFTNDSDAIILQIWNQNGVTHQGGQYTPASATSGPPNYALREGFTESFEEGDARLDQWVGNIESSDLDYINKYVLRGGSEGNEYYIVLRLAEMYLIRAEARAELEDLSGAESDLNIVRDRAGLPFLDDLDQEELLLAIEQEREVELFGEGHRWFDLIRRPSISDPSLTRADDILPGIGNKDWQSTDILLPIPATQMEVNPNIGPEDQNPGY